MLYYFCLKIIINNRRYFFYVIHKPRKPKSKIVSHSCVHKNLRMDSHYYRNAENESMTTDADVSANLKRISNDQLLLQTKNLVHKERQINIQVLQHLQEIEKRKLYLKRSFSSLFEYAVKELGYSESSAYRRIKAMKLCKELPETKAQISTGKLNLCTVSKLQTMFEKQEKQLKSPQAAFQNPQVTLQNPQGGFSESSKGMMASNTGVIQDTTRRTKNDAP